VAFQPRLKSDGSPCCTRVLSDGSKAYTRNPCQPCREHHRAAERRAAERHTSQDTNINNRFASSVPPDPYAEGLKRLRATAETLAPTFEDAWKAARRDALAAEYANHAARAEPTRLPRLTAAQLAQYAPPDIYAAGIKALQSKEEHNCG
jgi:hypothetical protein